MREKLVRFANAHHAEFSVLSQRAFRHPTGKAMRKFRSSLGRMEFVFWFTSGEKKRPARPLAKLHEAVRTLCDVEGALKRAANFGINSPSLKNIRKRCRRDIRQYLLPKNQKTLSSKITKIIAAVSGGQGLKVNEKMVELRNELARWKRKDLTVNRELVRLTQSLERARHLLDIHEKNADQIRAVLKSIHKSEELRTLRLSQPNDERLKLTHEKSLQLIGNELEDTLQFARKKLKAI